MGRRAPTRAQRGFGAKPRLSMRQPGVGRRAPTRAQRGFGAKPRLSMRRPAWGVRPPRGRAGAKPRLSMRQPGVGRPAPTRAQRGFGAKPRLSMRQPGAHGAPRGARRGASGPHEGAAGVRGEAPSNMGRPAPTRAQRGFGAKPRLSMRQPGAHGAPRGARRGASGPHEGAAGVRGEAPSNIRD